MQKESIRLEGLVLRSLDKENTRDFYQALLQTDFKLEQHDGGDQHYSARDSQRLLFEVYPCKMAVTPPSPDLTFRVLRKSIIQERMLDYIEEMKQTGEKLWEFQDPNERKITLFQDDDADDYITLHSIGLHCYSLNSKRDFYQTLLNIKAKEKKDNEGKVYYNFPLPNATLELHQSLHTVLPAPPTLLLKTSNFNYFTQRMRGRIKEIKQLPHTREAVLHPYPEGEKIRVYESIPEPSWWQKLSQ
ncbi:MAG: hypothetical protein AABX31_01865 [Nanoarchaeota archaeon]